MVNNVLVVGNINWINLREKHVKPLLRAGLNVTVLSDSFPEDKSYIDNISFIHLDKPKHTARSFFYLFILCFNSLITGKLFNRTEYLRTRFLYENALKYVHQISNLDFSRYDIVHCHFLTRPVCVGAIFSKIPLPVVATVHGSDLYVSARYSHADYQVLQRFFKNCHRIQAPGNSEKNYLLSLGCQLSKIVLLPWFVNDNVFSPADNKTTVESEREKWCVASDANVILSTRNLNEIYNIESIIKAFSRYAVGSYENSVLLIAGSGKKELELQALVASVDSQERIRFVGNLSPQELLELYQLSDLYIQNPLSDALPYSLLEAAVCGLPVICGEIGSIADFKATLLKGNIHHFLFSAPGVLNEATLVELLTQASDLAVKRYFSQNDYVRGFYGENASVQLLKNFYQDL